ncbi:putative NADH:ubiquinone reductase (non-electrogenic) [Helianthus annuus]|nr:putative NADH:ubiquinone reductase (non-electrogenic) [Helianthus annuus]KAJ0706965.1 putative NADH:ubiquinone reductase (non-electrogenic) [Helianthus annuus]KAJ0752906.1 putative NADH:ubiquinone reductase (non-electrogenic) [Helianthus annuus]KAJ0887598.1 putative NADH:ubiquinone reductase (non-electrogenic) [Helianthus annuus]
MGARVNTLNTPSVEENCLYLKFIVVGGGLTGVEFAAEFHDFVSEDLVKLYPSVKDFVKISLLEATNHILNMFDKRITAFAEEKFHVIFMKKSGRYCLFFRRRADKDESGTLTVKEFQDAVSDICDRYPQVQLYLKNKNMSSIVDLLKETKGDAVKEISVDEFKSALSQVNS